jgi:hypothetical protein
MLRLRQYPAKEMAGLRRLICYFEIICDLVLNNYEVGSSLLFVEQRYPSDF